MRKVTSFLLALILVVPSSWAMNKRKLYRSPLFHYKNADSTWVTLSEFAKYRGISLPHDIENYSDEEFLQTTQEYLKMVFGLIVQKAHKYGLEILGSDDFNDRRLTNGYWAFMVAALTVPFHESRFSHIRSQKPERCVEAANEFKAANNGAKSVSNSVRNLLNIFYRNPQPPLVANCDELQGSVPVNQMMFNGTALGMWQTNVRYHIDAVAPEVVLDLEETIDYGLGYLFRGSELSTSHGFYGILKDYQQYSRHCNFRSFDAKIHLQGLPKRYETINIYFNLIRGAYGGQYYYGQTLTPA